MPKVNNGLITEQQVENQLMQTNTLIFNAIINNAKEVFKARKQTATRISIVELNAPTEMPTYTLNKEGKLILELYPIPILAAGIYAIAQQPLSALIASNKISNDIKEDINLIKTNAWCIGSLEQAVKLYGVEIRRLPIQKIKSLDIMTIQTLKIQEMVKIATVDMLYITQGIMNNFQPNKNGIVRLKSKDSQGRGFEFELTDGMYVANYGNGEIAPIQQLDYDKTYIK
jgi:hypothetical protein